MIKDCAGMTRAIKLDRVTDRNDEEDGRKIEAGYAEAREKSLLGVGKLTGPSV